MKTELLENFEKQKKRLQRERIKEESLKALQQETKEKVLLNIKDKAEHQISHRELFDTELRESIKLAAEKRIDANFSQLIDAVDKMKKHLNIIDGVGNGENFIPLILPGEIFKKYNNVVEGETIPQQQLQ